jgi:hypothetical protein
VVEVVEVEAVGGGGAEVGVEMDGTSCTLLKERIGALDEMIDSRTLAWKVERKALMFSFGILFLKKGRRNEECFVWWIGRKTIGFC